MDYSEVIFFCKSTKGLFNGPSGFDGFEYVFRGSLPEADYIPVAFQGMHHKEKKAYLKLFNIGVFEGKVETNLSGNQVKISVPGLGYMFLETKTYVAWNNPIHARFAEDYEGNITIEHVTD